MNGDILIVAVFTVTLVNFARYLSSLRALVVMLRDANPLLYQQICRGDNNFFSLSPQGDISRQKRLYQYIRSQEYLHHHDEIFVGKCNKVRHLFILNAALSGALLATFFLVAFAGW
ncbi:universal stress protein UspB [Salinivibrio sp. PR6]|uniref:universal stress protein UspB n=1 Tax=unclassified Salinivibrio TaxID=2636825 RepID=UPI000984E4E4|nr:MULTISPECIES: universal stress protein UspB [unclassified Salinivibrio]OOE68053.1 universal stress protein UspB [Salinivibrio sp. IB868]OOE74347.1 universal stress protein UspB [Salinivibrio sp. ML290]OOE74844.1 universal stress protein UspB [Salinivibrio sp. IB870]OOE83253.1 universal stress protein UspB [Salinivibrio sp. PR6]